MGRAQTRTQAVALGRFEAVFGRRQGSSAAQAERDAAEEAVLQVQQEFEMANLLTDVSGVAARRIAKTLVRAYRARSAADGVVDVILPPADGRGSTYRARSAADGVVDIARRQIRGAADSALLEDLTGLILGGDPPSCPGLTAPLVKAMLATYFRRISDDAQLNGKLLIDRMFAKGSPLAKDADVAVAVNAYRRLTPLCVAMGPLIAANLGTTPRATNLAAGIGRAAALALREAPAEVLAGPLQTWVAAMEERIDKGRATTLELGMLRQAVAEQPPGGVGAAVLAGIAARLAEK